MWAISVGRRWSYFPLPRARDNIIEFNHCHHVGTGVLGSHCAIYAPGTSPGTVIRNNYIHHVFHSERWKGAGEGIILDNGCRGILVENNIVHDAVSGGYGSNYNCYGNIIQKNIPAPSTLAGLLSMGLMGLAIAWRRRKRPVRLPVGVYAATARRLTPPAGTSRIDAI